MWKCIFGYGNTRFCLCQDTGAMNRPLRLTECSHPISWVYVECFAECSPRIRNPFRMHSRNVRNVFVICVLHIRHAKVWFLRCKSMVFGVQKGGFYIAKVWFLFFECCVVAICLECYGNPFAMLLQFVRHAFAIRSECIHVMFATCSLSVCYIFAMQKYGFCVAKVWFLACKKGVFTLQKYGFCFLNVGLLQFVWNVMAIRQQHFGNPSAAVGVRFIVPAYIYSPPILCVFG